MWIPVDACSSRCALLVPSAVSWCRAVRCVVNGFVITGTNVQLPQLSLPTRLCHSSAIPFIYDICPLSQFPGVRSSSVRYVPVSNPASASSSVRYFPVPNPASRFRRPALLSALFPRFTVSVRRSAPHQCAIHLLPMQRPAPAAPPQCATFSASAARVARGARPLVGAGSSSSSSSSTSFAVT